jgi:acetyl-CoA synthetase
MHTHTLSYIVYGPLCNGVTTVMFESTPMYPDYGRYWDLVQRHKVTSFYTAPTAIRAIMAKVLEYDWLVFGLAISLSLALLIDGFKIYINVCFLFC